MAPASKRRKTQPQRYECHTCLVSRISSQFPNSNPTPTCGHLINTCKRCLKEWVESQIETRVFTPHIACPECEQKMGREDVAVVVTQRLFARYLRLERVYTAENNPGWRWCLAAGCGAGQVHVKSENGDDGIPGQSERSDSHNGPLGGSWLQAGEGGGSEQSEQTGSDDDDIGGSWSQDGAEWAKGSVPPQTLERQRQQLEQQRQHEQQQHE